MLKKGTIFLPWADVKGGGWVGLNINVKLTLTVAMWVWMRPLIYEKLGMKPGYFTTIGCSKLNNARLINAYKASCEVRINRRRHLRGTQKRRSDKHKETEGVVYGVGEFTVE